MQISDGTTHSLISQGVPSGWCQLVMWN